ncbi:Gfo/Idh/MocA family oxidoreductase [Paenibacillus filicis]|uniref:Gfo/Idh/MocA family oxidoreductase n=1 Tax=Paenibacillus gyeongsangnamensis TaxID=3388067 RepID=A0ABT4Q9A0_9BACL|nr:Gfo/Idh/MocA family oxidoreductase [Paenibacillus filicis]MCZ8513404.1 Gfo/Idh/MocA family oxidoreductase [Paenibacillus filicis]
MERKLRWGVLGTGRILGKAGAALKTVENGEWLGVAGRSPGRSAEAAERFGVPRAYDSYEELLQDPDIDAVYIALLNHLHAEWAVRACRAGKHVLLEKPFAPDADEAERIVEAARSCGVVVEEAFVWRHHPAFTALRELIAEGIVGDWVCFRGHYSFPAGEDSTRWVREWGGGALLDIGCYPVAWARFITGEEPSSVDAAELIDDKHGVDRRFAGTLYFSGGRTAHFDAALDMAHGADFELIGTKGRISVELRVDAESWTIASRQGLDERVWTMDRITPFRREAEAFAARAMGASSEEAQALARDAVNQARVLGALRQSAERGERVWL